MTESDSRGKRGLFILGLLLILLSILIPIYLFMFYFSHPDEIDSWYDKADPGDRIIVAGFIDKKEDREKYVEYTFRDSDTQIYSKDDIGDESDFVIVKIERSEIGAEVVVTYSINIFILLPIAGLVLGGIFVAISRRRVTEVSEEIGVKEAEELPEIPEYPCNKCGSTLTYIEQYGRWYCYTCEEYAPLPDEEQREIPSSEKIRCPSCGIVFETSPPSDGTVVCPHCRTKGVLKT